MNVLVSEDLSAASLDFAVGRRQIFPVAGSLRLAPVQEDSIVTSLMSQQGELAPA